jgi:adhesin transport system outer membrane protein
LSLALIATSALNQYPSIRASKDEARAAEADLDGARWQRFPTPSIEASQSDAGDDAAVIRLQQPLWTGGRISAAVDAAEARLSAARGGIGEAEQEVLFRVAEAFVEAERRQAQRVNSIENVRRHEELHNLIRRRVEQRISPQVDLALANSRLAQAQSQLSLVDQQLAVVLQELEELAGRSVAEVMPLSEQAQTLPDNLANARREALRYSPERQRLDRERMAANADVRAERAKRLPDLAIRIEHERADEADSRALLVLESEFGAGLSSAANSRAAASRRDALRREREALSRQLETRVSRAWQGWRAARIRMESAEMQRESTQRVFESYTRQYVIGQKSWLDVLNAVREASKAANAVADARAQANGPMLRIAILTGRIAGVAHARSYSEESEVTNER